ncbi:glycosyltransferase family 1 protein [Candidatus Peribacteria bacterium]|nr:glycosyltransferase family 1 protein [Candidatus Peribacteria bacterium]
MQCIGIDGRFASGVGGLGTFTRGIVRALLQRSDPWNITLFVNSRSNEWLSDFSNSPRLSIVLAPFPHYSLSEQCRFPSIIKASGCDLFFSPHFIAPLFCPVPTIVTVHDLILHHYPNEAGLLRRLAYRFLFASSLRAATAIVTVSESTKRDLLKRHPDSERKLTVSYPGIDEGLVRATENDISRVRQHYHLEKPFLLYVGNCKEHKNVPMLIEAFKQASLPNTDLVLVCGGKECESLVLPEGVRKISEVRGEEFSAFYSAALALVTASLDEGFGLPMVEAMACGTPVLATTCGSIPEICGEHALLVEPITQALSAGIQRIATDPIFRSASALQAASQWVRKYDWNASAATLAALFSKHLSTCPTSAPPLHSPSI